MDSSATNAYFMTAPKPEEDTQNRAHRKFQENLTMQLLEVMEDGPQQVAEPVQTRPEAPQRWRPLVKKSYCRYCRDHKEQAVPKKKRKVLGDLPNGPNRGPRAFIPQTFAACDYHGVPLCRKSDCWNLYHTQIAESGLP